MADRSVREYTTQAPAQYIGDFLQGGIFPYAQGFLKDQFQNLGTPDSSPYTYTGQRVADFDPREQYAMDMSDQAIGSYRPYLEDQGQLLSDAGAAARGGTAEGQGLIRSGLGAGADFTREAAGIARGSAPDFGSARAGLGRAEQTGIDSTGMYDPNSAQGFYNPYEQQVVDQTMKDVREGLAKGDMGMRDEAVSGGAFGGSRSRMRRDELAANAARGAAQQVGALRSQGFGQAQNQAQQAFEAQQGRRAGLAGLQSGLAGQRGTLAGAEGQAALARSGQLGGFGQQAYGMSTGAGQGIAGLGTGLGQNLAGYGAQTGAMGQQLAGLQGADINRTMGMGGLNRGRTQSEMDLAYQNFVGQYNLPMQTLQNVGSLTSSLAPIAGGYGYAGSDQDVALTGSGQKFAPVTGGIGSMYSSVGTGAGGGVGGGAGPGGGGAGPGGGNAYALMGQLPSIDMQQNRATETQGLEGFRPQMQVSQGLMQQPQGQFNPQGQSAGNIPGFGQIYKQQGEGFRPTYTDASGNPLPQNITSSWGRGRHGEMMLPQQYSNNPQEQPYRGPGSADYRPQGQQNQYGHDPRAIAANPQGYQNYLQGAQAQETRMPGSTFHGGGFSPNIGQFNPQGMQSLNSGLQPKGRYSGPSRIGGGGQPPVGGVGGTGQQSTLTPAQRSMMVSHLSNPAAVTPFSTPAQKAGLIT